MNPFSSQGPLLVGQEDVNELKRRDLHDAYQQLAQGNPQNALEIVLNLLSKLNLPEELSAAALRVRDAMKDGTSPDASAHLAGLLGALNIEPRNGELDSAGAAGRHLGPQGEAPLDMQIDMPESRNNHQHITINLPTPADGEASYVCERCGEVISAARRAAHDEVWCIAARPPSLPPDG